MKELDESLRLLGTALALQGLAVPKEEREREALEKAYQALRFSVTEAELNRWGSLPADITLNEYVFALMQAESPEAVRSFRIDSEGRLDGLTNGDAARHSEILLRMREKGILTRTIELEGFLSGSRLGLSCDFRTPRLIPAPAVKSYARFPAKAFLLADLRRNGTSAEDLQSGARTEGRKHLAAAFLFCFWGAVTGIAWTMKDGLALVLLALIPLVILTAWSLDRKQRLQESAAWFAGEHSPVVGPASVILRMAEAVREDAETAKAAAEILQSLPVHFEDFYFPVERVSEK